MNIKEVEQITGMSRANIRYYESEGLIHPLRNENGYRDYSADDIEILNKIKLLRLIHVSIEDIKSLEEGKTNLRNVMEVNVMKLEGEIKQFETSKKISEHIAQNEAGLEKLSADEYLSEIDQADDRKYIAKNLSEDKSNYNMFEWRRYFARSIDLLIYEGIVTFIQYKCGMSTETINSMIFSLLLIMAMMLFIEPVFLSLFKTTPGKWLFRLRIEHNGNRPLTYIEGFKRTFILLVKGVGFGIPVIDLWREYDSFLKVSDGRSLSWEENTDSYTRPLTISGYRILFVFMVYIMVIVFSVVFESM